MTERDDPSLSTGAYALGALTGEEEAAFEAYLARSESLRTEVAGFTDTAVELGLATTPVTPPPDLRARVLQLAATTPQLPAISGTQDSGAAESERTAPAAYAPVYEATVQAHTPPAATAPAEPATGATGTGAARAGAAPAGATPAADRANARWFGRTGTVLAAAAAAVAVLVGGIAIGSTLQDRGELEQVQAQAAALAELNAAPDVQRVSAEVAEGATATLVWSGELSRSAVVFDELDPLPDDRVYQAWYINAEGAATSAGTFRADEDAATFRVLDGSLASGSVVGVTVEPDGGSDAPTTEPIVAIEAA
ncbi:anti-sigma factor [Planctomonas psychrotolerans]|uniref:anti-sigma factor n=1 Tax=Planctomonas psychrotolerans TaxID=2528712 RepID=UPI00123C15BF|nr:anti-sigma factor [Planctomonas psychrotolerans]